MKCTQCKINDQSVGAEPLCGSCWAKDTSTTISWPTYSQTTLAMLSTGKVCRVCYRKLYALPGDDKSANICTDCAGLNVKKFT
jgi:hypothetical protein